MQKDFGFERVQQVFETAAIQEVDCAEGMIGHPPGFGLTSRIHIFTYFQIPTWGRVTGIISGLPSMAEPSSSRSSYLVPG